MAAKRKKSGELWLSKPDSLDTQRQDNDQILPKYIELRQKIELLEEEKDKNLMKLKQLEQTIQAANSKCATHLHQISELKSLIAELEYKLEKKCEQYNQVIKQLEDEKKQFHQQEEKWEVFQKDLLTTVRVANDLKTEAEEQSDLLLNENKTLSEKILSLENELSKLKVNKCDESTNKLQGDLNTESKNDLKSNPKSELKNDLKNESQCSEKIVFRAESESKRIDNLKRNANCFAETNALHNLDKNKLIRQQSADSVFSSSIKDRQLNQRNTSQSLILSANKNKISVKSLVETIENASKTNQAISKSPSFNSINLNSNSIGSTLSNNVKNKIEEGKSAEFSNSKSLDQQSNGKTDTNKLDQKSESKFENRKFETNKQENEKLDHRSVNDISSTKMTTSTRTLPNYLINSKKENCPINLNSNNESNALNNLIKEAGSIRNGLLRWCKKKTENYEGIEISNFSSSWTNSLVICALLHSLDHKLIPFHTLDRNNKKKNFKLAFNAAESLGIQCNLNIEDLINEERPDWSKIMAYVTSIYNHFESKSH